MATAITTLQLKQSHAKYASQSSEENKGLPKNWKSLNPRRRVGCKTKRKTKLQHMFLMRHWFWFMFYICNCISCRCYWWYSNVLFRWKSYILWGSKLLCLLPDLEESHLYGIHTSFTPGGSKQMRLEVSYFFLIYFYLFLGCMHSN